MAFFAYDLTARADSTAYPLDQLREKGIADVDIGQSIPLDETTDADRLICLLQHHQVQAKPVFGITGDGAVLDVGTRFLQRSNTAIADILDEGGLVQ